MSREQAPAQRVRPAANAAGRDSGAALTCSELDVLRHSLGLDRGRRIYRNHFVADVGHADMPALQSLVAKGLMVRRADKLSADWIFYATDDGMRAARHARKEIAA